MLHKNVECYIDILVVKSKKRNDHVLNLHKVFKRFLWSAHLEFLLRKHLDFIVQNWGIEIDQFKIDTIIEMSEPQNIHELKSLQGKLTYMWRFISNLVGHCQPFHRLIKKDTSFVWNQACQNAFNNIKAYLLKPLVSRASIVGLPLILYSVTQ